MIWSDATPTQQTRQDALNTQKPTKQNVLYVLFREKRHKQNAQN